MRSQAEFRQARRAHWDGVARRLDHWRGWGGPYQRRLAEVYRFAVPPGLKVLELGCGPGDLLAALKPSLGVGVDLSLEMLRRAKTRHPELHYLQGDAQSLRLHQRFDVIILSDLVNDLWDAQTVLENLGSMVHARSRVILNSYSRVWEFPLALAQRLGLAKPSLQQNWFTPDDIVSLFQLTSFEAIRGWTEVLLPLRIPWLAAFANRILVQFWPFRHLALTNFTIARPLPSGKAGAPPTVSVIVPARNEAGNIPRIFQVVPASLPGCELDLRRRSLARQHLRSHPAAMPGAATHTGPASSAGRRRQGRCGTPGLRAGHRRDPGHPGRRPDRGGGRPAAVYRGVGGGQGRPDQRRAPGLSHGKAKPCAI